MDTGTELFLLAVDPDRHGRPRFGAKLAPVLVLADVLDKAARGRTVPDAMVDHLAARASNRLRSHTEAAGQRGILAVSVRTEGYFDHTRITVVDRWPIDRAVDRLHRMLDAAGPARDGDLAFLALLEEIGRAQVHLGGWTNRHRRQRLGPLLSAATEPARRQSVVLSVLQDGLRAVREMTAD